MERLLLKAATTATDEGIFEAVISTASVDRDQDIVEPAAMVAALKKWADVGKLVPLAWAHSEDVVGHIEPVSARIAKKEVIASGWIDQSDELGAKAWRLIKSGTLSFSFGYLIPKNGADKRPEGGLHIKEIDVFEISVVPVGPANNDTRVLSFKTADALLEETKKVEREVEEHAIPDDVPDPKDIIVPEPEPQKSIDPAPPRDAETLRRETKRVALDLERKANDEQIRELPALPDPDPSDPGPDVITELQEVKSQLAEVREALKPPTPDPAELRKEAARVEREVEQAQLPKVPEASAPEPEPQVDIAKELQEVKALLTETREQLEDLKTRRTEETDQEPARARSVDPQRKQAEALALEVASGGRGLHKPPPTVAPAKPEPVYDLKELKQRTRDEMLGVLSGRSMK